MTQVKEYYYVFVSEEESDFEGGLVIIEDKERYDDDFIQLGLEPDQYPALFAILDAAGLDQEQENYFSNHEGLTEDQFLKLFENQPIKLIHKPDMW